MNSPLRYPRLLLSFARFGLAREMAFRWNFIIQVAVEILWLVLLLFFYRTVFTLTRDVQGWNQPQYLFFLGCYFAMEGVMESFFITNCNEFADLIRTGDLDFYLLQPIDEQFLVSCRNVSWSSVPSIFMGVAVMGMALHQMEWSVNLGQVGLFIILFCCGVSLAYSFLLMLTSASVWMLRNQSLYELWWLLTSLMRYPKEIFNGTWFTPFSWVLTFVVPVLLIINVPARSMVKLVDPENSALVWYMAGATVVMGWVSRRFFRYALQKYRSASS